MARPSRRLADKVYGAVVGEIQSGALQGGDRLVENLLANEYGVSRTPVREALQRLIHNGYAVSDAAGVVVSTPSEEEIYNAYILRETLEGLASSLAAARCTEVDALRLTAIHTRFEAATAAADVPAAVDLTLEFHGYIWKLSGSDILRRVMVDLVDEFWSRLTPSTLSTTGRAAGCENEHRQILDAITNGRVEDAEKAAKAHIREARDTRIRGSV